MTAASPAGGGGEAPLHPALDRLLLAARDKRERRGAAGDGTVVLSDIGPEEALALDGLLSPVRRAAILPGTMLRVSLSRVEEALRACGRDPRAEYERAAGRPLRDLPAERIARRAARGDFAAWLRAHEVPRARPPVAAWLDQALRRGTVTAQMRPLVERALAIVAQLPAAAPLQRSVLAARLLDGDPHALDMGTPLHGLTVALLRAGAGLDPDASPRRVWAAFNVVVDPVSSFVVALNLPLTSAGGAPRSPLPRLPRGVHAVFTFGQLSAAELRWPVATPCFSCENPSVLTAAEQELGAACPPLLCTGGRPSDAVRLVLDAVARAGAPILHHGDFDEAGVQILEDLHDRHRARPWRFDLAALETALRRLGRPPAPPAATLSDAVRGLPAAVPEELLLDDLLGDLKRLDVTGVSRSATTSHQLEAAAPFSPRHRRHSPHEHGMG